MRTRRTLILPAVSLILCLSPAQAAPTTSYYCQAQCVAKDSRTSSLSVLELMESRSSVSIREAWKRLGEKCRRATSGGERHLARGVTLRQSTTSSQVTSRSCYRYAWSTEGGATRFFRVDDVTEIQVELAGPRDGETCGEETVDSDVYVGDEKPLG